MQVPELSGLQDINAAKIAELKRSLGPSNLGISSVSMSHFLSGGTMPPRYSNPV